MSNTSKLQAHLKDIVCLLNDYYWLLNFPMIEVLSSNCIDLIPSEWKLWFQKNGNDVPKTLINLLFKTEEIECLSFKEFLLECNKCSVRSILDTSDGSDGLSFDSWVESKNCSNDLEEKQEEPTETQLNGSWNNMKNIGPKKKHEVELLGHYVNIMASVTNCNRIVDIGSGLGYLHIFLHEKRQFMILGVEHSEKKIVSAKKLLNRCLGHQCPDIQYMRCYLKDDFDTLKKLDEDFTHFSSSIHTCNLTEATQNSVDINFPGVNLISLHSCADLSPIMLKCFVRCTHVQSLFMVPCCYHKMKFCVNNTTDWSRGSCTTTCSSDAFEVKDTSRDFGNPLAYCNDFDNFPMSEAVAVLLEEYKLQLNISSMRLASEESALHWQKRSNGSSQSDANGMAFRAILNSVCKQRELTVFKTSRKLANKSCSETFDLYLNCVFERCQFRMKNGRNLDSDELPNFRHQLISEYTKQKHNTELIGFVRLLQLSLQPALESLILLDRVCFLRGHGFPKSGIVQLFDERISSRNSAIFAFRSHINCKSFK